MRVPNVSRSAATRQDGTEGEGEKEGSAPVPAGIFCLAHSQRKRRVCKICPKLARGATEYCTAHGGGKRCGREGCDKSARGSTNYCTTHGRDRECEWEGCDEFAICDA